MDAKYSPRLLSAMNNIAHAIIKLEKMGVSYHNNFIINEKSSFDSEYIVYMCNFERGEDVIVWSSSSRWEMLFMWNILYICVPRIRTIEYEIRVCLE